MMPHSANAACNASAARGPFWGRLRAGSLPVWIQRYATVARTVGVSLSVYGVFAVQGMLLARLLGPEARGEFATSVLYTQALTYVGLFGAAFAIARRANRYEDDLGGLERSALRLGLTTAVGTMAVVAILNLAALPVEKQYLIPLCLLCSLYLPFEQMRLTLQAVDHGRREFRLYDANRLLAAMMLPSLLAAAWLLGQLTVPVVACLSVAAPALGLAHRLRHLHPVARPQEAPAVGAMLREGAPYCPSVLVADGFNRLDAILMAWLASLAVQGYYTAAIAAAGVLGVAPTALALFSFNVGARAGDGPGRGAFWAVAGAVTLMQAVCALSLAWALPWLMTFVFGSKFSSATPLALALLPAHALGGCALVAEGYLRGAGQAGAGAWARGVGVLVMLAAVAWGYPRWESFSVPYGYAAGQAACALCMFAFVLRGKQATDPADSSEPLLAGGEA